MRIVLSLLCVLSLPVGRAVAQAGAAVPLTLAEAMQRGLTSAPGVVAARAGVQQAEARKRETRGDLLPRLDADASYVNRTYNIHTFGIEFPSAPGEPFPDLVGPFGVSDARATLHQKLFDYAAIARVRSSGGAVDVSRASEAITKEKAAELIAVAYVRAVRANALIAARTADVDVAQQLADLAQLQLNAGVSAGIDVTRARTQLTGARSLLLIAENDAARAGIDLARSMGRDPASRFTPSDTLSGAMVHSEAPETREVALASAKARRPDLELERATAQLASLQKSAVRAERLPSLSLQGDAGISGPSFSDGIFTRQLALAFTMPLFDGLRREARIAEQDAVIDAANARQRDVELQLASEVEEALIDITSAAEQERVALEGLTLAEAELSQARERFEGGIAGNIEVINAQSSLIRARTAVIEARATGAIARIRLARATGTAATIR
ncbi:MAG TPA: TolC family protein [Gemmatimonadales bacterium]|nr:TolC family protein [Gemmatimonadales bacterium]